MDLALAVKLYLKDKKHLIQIGESWNAALLLQQKPIGWKYANIPMPTLSHLQRLLDWQKLTEVQ